jgi:hypothetical protein
MRSLIIVVIVFIFGSCHSRSSINDEKDTEIKADFFYEILNIPDTLLQKYEPAVKITQTIGDGRIELTVSQRQKLFEWNPDAINDNAYLYGIREIHDGIYLLFVLSESISDEKFYMMAVDSSATKLDYIYFSEGDFFDVIDQSEESETGLFITKYFQLLNDTVVSFRSIIKEEKKAREGGIILSSQVDSLTHDYLVNKKGKFDLIHRDSVRLYLK